ncbi:hypothetical protein C0J52_11105 [Blattella germanica]|nr:hypothetical protein C0J52_11105 [Blattella germanica]
MLSRFSTVIQNAVDALAPPVPLLEDFTYHWKMVMKFYGNGESVSKTVIEATNIPAHLDQLLKILLEEEANQESGATGPCLEYLLQHRLLDLLVTLACTDCPPGMRQFTLVFMRRLITQIKQPLLPHVSVYGPVQKNYDIDVLLATETKLAPHLHYRIPEGALSPVSTPTSSPALSSKVDKFQLLDALLSFLQSADSRVVVKACEGVMVMASLPSDIFAHSVATQSDLCRILASKLETLFETIPPEIEPNDLDDLQINWGFDSPVWQEGSEFPGCRQVAAFLAWLDYCDQLARESHPIISSALAASIRTEFLERVLSPALMLSETADKVLITAFISKCLKQHVLHCLVLVYLTSRSYYDTSVSDSAIGSWSDEEDERERQRDGPTLDFSSGSSPISRTLAPNNIDKIINRFMSINELFTFCCHSFLLLLPQHLHSTTDPDETGYEQYVQDADRQYQACIARCTCYAWPCEATFPDSPEYDDSGSSDSRPEADHARQFYEGPFLRMLFTRLVRLPYQPYEINLQLTGLVSRLAMLPHPFLHEFLLNPLLPVLSGANSLFSTLQLVASELMTQVPALKNYKQLLPSTRQKLLGDGTDAPEEENSVLESVVVLEEFCKELAAIAFVKYHHSS